MDMEVATELHGDAASGKGDTRLREKKNKKLMTKQRQQQMKSRRVKGRRKGPVRLPPPRPAPKSFVGLPAKTRCPVGARVPAYRHAVPTASGTEPPRHGPAGRCRPTPGRSRRRNY